MDYFIRVYEYKNKKELKDLELNFYHEIMKYMIEIDKLIKPVDIKIKINDETKNIEFCFEFYIKRDRNNLCKSSSKVREKIKHE